MGYGKDVREELRLPSRELVDQFGRLRDTRDKVLHTPRRLEE
jgi:hypothetical protein